MYLLEILMHRIYLAKYVKNKNENNLKISLVKMCLWKESYVAGRSYIDIFLFYDYFCQYCAMGLGWVGLDFRGLLPPLFEE